MGFSTWSSNFDLRGGVTGSSHALRHNCATGETRALTNNNFGSVRPVALTRRAAYAAFGSAGEEDPRFRSTGLFAHCTGAERAWYWID